MSAPPRRVAVQVGGHTLRIAGVAVDGAPWLVERPADSTAADRLCGELVGPDPPDELVIVHPAGWSAGGVAGLVRQLAPTAARVQPVPAPAAAAGPRATLVLDVGRSGAELTRLAADGAITDRRWSPIGGTHLDARVSAWLCTRAGPTAGAAVATTAARALRERLALLPAATVTLPEAGPVEVTSGQLAAVLDRPLRELVGLVEGSRRAAGPLPVLLIGGVARTPLLAQLLDEGGCPQVTVADRPEAAAVLGALRPDEPGTGGGPVAVGPPAGSGIEPAAGPPPADPSAAEPVVEPAVTGPPAAEPATGRPEPAARDPASSPAEPAAEAAADWFPPPPRRPVRAALLTGVAIAAAVAPPAAGFAPGPPPASRAVPAGVLVQYGYRFDLPAGWAHTGGLPQRRRVLLTPAAAPESSDVIAVERSALGYDTGVERARALGELRAEFDRAVATGAALSDYRAETVAGRDVTRYRQRDPGGDTGVDWYVVLDGDAQLSVGCRHHRSTAAAIGAACALVVGSVRLT